MSALQSRVAHVLHFDPTRMSSSRQSKPSSPTRNFGEPHAASGRSLLDLSPKAQTPAWVASGAGHVERLQCSPGRIAVVGCVPLGTWPMASRACRPTLLMTGADDAGCGRLRGGCATIIASGRIPYPRATWTPCGAPTDNRTILERSRELARYERRGDAPSCGRAFEGCRVVLSWVVTDDMNIVGVSRFQQHDKRTQHNALSLVTTHDGQNIGAAASHGRSAASRRPM
jgi:hypothetical protein